MLFATSFILQDIINPYVVISQFYVVGAFVTKRTDIILHVKWTN